jgi:hypothetical protein
MTDRHHTLDQSTTGIVRIFCWVILAGAVVGLAAAHGPWIIGQPWSTCRVAGSELGCALVFHLYEVPLVLMNLFVVWYGLRRLSGGTVIQFSAFVSFMVVANAAFLTFEASLLMDSLRRGAPDWENLGLAVISLILLGGCIFGIYIVHRLIGAVTGSSMTTPEAE